MTRVMIAFSNRLHRQLPLFIGVLLSLVLACTAQAQIDREEIVVVNAGRIITGAGENIEHGRIVIVDGQIAHVGRNVDYPASAVVIDATSEVVMPGLIHLATRSGLPSYSRNGVNPHERVTDEIYPAQLDFEPLLREGFTAACFVPDGTGLPGAAAVYRTGGNGDRLLRENAYLRVTMSNPARDKSTLRDAIKKARAEIEKIEKARAEWEKKQKKAAEKAGKESESKNGEGGEDDGDNSAARDDDGEESDSETAEEKAPAEFTPPTINPALQPLVDWLQKKPGVQLFIEIGSASDLHHLDDVLEPFPDLPVTYVLSSFGRDFRHVVQTLGERNARIMTGPTIRSLPNTVIRYNLVGELIRAGAEVALLPVGDAGRLRVLTADVVRGGMSREDAVRALTMNPALFLQLEERLGSIESEKDADLVFMNGDPLDGHSRVTRTMIRGKVVWTNEEEHE